MAKVCSWDDCENLVFSKGLCQYHWRMRWAKPLKVNNTIKKSTKRVKPFSDKMISKLAKYKVVRDKWLKEHGVCEFEGCGSREVTLHHKKGRLGDLLINTDYFCSLCWQHHFWVETHPEEAIKMGLSCKRN